MTKYLDLLGLTTYDLAIKLYIDNSTPESITTEEIEELFSEGDIPGGHNVTPNVPVPNSVVFADTFNALIDSPNNWPNEGVIENYDSDTLFIRITPDTFDTSDVQLRAGGNVVNPVSAWSPIQGVVRASFNLNYPPDTQFELYINGTMYGGIIKH